MSTTAAALLPSAEIRVHGACLCGRRVTHIHNSIRPTCRTDCTRFIYTDAPDDGWCIFRCASCGKVISESFCPDPA